MKRGAALVGLAVASCGRIDFDTTKHAEYVASVAECIDPTAPDLVACTTVRGADQLVVDGKDATTRHPWHSFVRFDLDAAVGTRVARVVLRVSATDASLAKSSMTGQVWRVGAFTRDDLAVAEPAMEEMLAADEGAVAKLQIVEWPLPAGIVSPGQSIYVGLFPVATEGVNYYNLLGALPPTLAIDGF